MINIYIYIYPGNPFPHDFWKYSLIINVRFVLEHISPKTVRSGLKPGTSPIFQETDAIQKKHCYMSNATYNYNIYIIHTINLTNIFWDCLKLGVYHKVQGFAKQFMGGTRARAILCGCAATRVFDSVWESRRPNTWPLAPGPSGKAATDLPQMAVGIEYPNNWMVNTC